MNSDSLKRAALLGVLWLTASTGGFRAEEVRPAQEGGIEFYDARQQAFEFIALFHSIVLTDEQERTKNEALSVLPAPCCASAALLQIRAVLFSRSGWRNAVFGFVTCIGPLDENRRWSRLHDSTMLPHVKQPGASE